MDVCQRNSSSSSLLDVSKLSSPWFVLSNFSTPLRDAPFIWLIIIPHAYRPRSCGQISLDWTFLHCLVLLFAPCWRWLWFSETLTFASPWFRPICMDSQFQKMLPPPMTSDHQWLLLLFLVDLTLSTFCVHICRRQLQTSIMAVRLCDVASLLRSGSWAAEPWTGVCGTSFLN